MSNVYCSGKKVSLKILYTIYQLYDIWKRQKYNMVKKNQWFLEFRGRGQEMDR